MKTPLKLIAFDEDDLGILSFYVQNARICTDNIVWQAQEKRFLMALQRFTVQENPQAGGQKSPDDKNSCENLEKPAEKMAAAHLAVKEAIKTSRAAAAVLHFDRVLSVRSVGIDRKSERKPLLLWGIYFHKKQAPSGIIELIFAEQARLQMEVECIEARLQDMSE